MESQRLFNAQPSSTVAELDMPAAVMDFVLPASQSTINLEEDDNRSSGRDGSPLRLDGFGSRPNLSFHGNVVCHPEQDEACVTILPTATIAANSPHLSLDPNKDSYDYNDMASTTVMPSDDYVRSLYNRPIDSERSPSQYETSLKSSEHY